MIKKFYLFFTSGRNTSQTTRLIGHSRSRTNNTTSHPGLPRNSASRWTQMRLQINRPRTISMNGMRRKIKTNSFISHLLSLFQLRCRLRIISLIDFLMLFISFTSNMFTYVSTYNYCIFLNSIHSSFQNLNDRVKLSSGI